MSYILDALKKSESDRQQSHAAGIADIPSRSRRTGTPAWVWLLSGLLLLNAAALGYLLLAPDEETPPVADVTAPANNVPAAVSRSSGNSSDPALASASTATPSADTGIPGTSQEPVRSTPADVLPSTSPPPQASRPSAAAAAPTRAPVPARANGGSVAVAQAEPARDDVTEATFMELRANGSLQTPDLHLDIHVYSETPAERFVFINMSKYREKERLAEGPVIREIIPNGVVLEEGRHRFLLPRE